MTEDDQDLLERLEAIIANAWDDDEHETLSEARDRIEAQAAENERLREALGEVSVLWRRHKYSGDFDLWLNSHIRAALRETK